MVCMRMRGIGIRVYKRCFDTRNNKRFYDIGNTDSYLLGLLGITILLLKRFLWIYTA